MSKAGKAATIGGGADGPTEGLTAGQAAALESVFDEAVALFFRLRAVAGRLHGQGEGTSGRRAVLRELRRDGPKTVPQMARARPVSRQSMQSAVNALLADGLVELVGNPAHKTSKLVRLTARGEDLLREMDRREAEALAELGVEVPEQDLREAAQVLASVRATLEGERARELLEDEGG